MLTHKPIENRDWSLESKGFAIPQRIYVHAAKVPDDNLGFREAFDILRKLYGLSDANIIWRNYWRLGQNYGALIGKITIVADVTKSDSPWFFGKHGFVREAPEIFDHPIPYRGQLGFFEVKL